MPLRAILFDKDGTLIDFQRTWGRAFQVVLPVLAKGDAGKMAQLAEALDFKPVTGVFLPTSPLIAGSSADYGGVIAEILGEEPGEAFNARMDAMLTRAGLDSVSPIGDVKALLTGLAAQGYALGVCTNDAEASARAHCQILGIDGLMMAIMGYDSGLGRKPDADPLLAFCASQGLAPEELALVGDSLHDMHAARAAGGIGIAVLTGFASRDDFAGHADYVLDSIADLPALLGSGAV